MYIHKILIDDEDDDEYNEEDGKFVKKVHDID